MERYGIAGHGWGAAWLSEDGRLERHRFTGALHEDPGSERVADVRSARVLIHLRRPTRLSTIQLEDTQPFLQEQGSFAFCHNGVYARHEEYRSRFAGRLAGQADSEIGFRLFEELLGQGGDPVDAVERTALELGGAANLAFLANDGTLVVRAGHPGNLIWRFSLEGMEVAATELHSRDSSLFDLVFPDAQNRRVLESVDSMARASAVR